jgi:hypothetical protein
VVVAHYVAELDARFRARLTRRRRRSVTATATG